MSHISLDDIVGLIDNELSPEERYRIAEHVKSCPSCKERVSKAVTLDLQFQKFIEEAVFSECPENDMLFSYLEGQLDQTDKTLLEKHLQSCPRCQQRIEVAREATEEMDLLERSATLSAIVSRIREQLPALNVKRIIKALKETLIQTGIGKEVFSFLRELSEPVKYSFSSPLESPVLLPVTSGGIKLAKTGKGFERKVITEEGVPFRVELVQFGNRFSINLESIDEKLSEALVRYTLFEDDTIRYEGVIPVSDGKASINLSEEDVEKFRPQKSPLNLRLEVIIDKEVLQKATKDDIVKLLDLMTDTLLSRDPEVVAHATDVFERFEKSLREKP